MNKQPNSQNIEIKPLEGEFRDRSFWLENLPEVPEMEPLRGSTRCDVAIIGGGYTGLSTAYHVRKLLPGISVRVLEANRCGSGSSGRNFGACGTLFGLAKSTTASRFGKEQAIAAHHYMEDAVDHVEQLVCGHALDCDYEQNGTLLVATTKAQVRRVNHELRIADEWGLTGYEARNEARLAEEFHTRH